MRDFSESVYLCGCDRGRDELRRVLDPQEVYGRDFPGETFRVLKEKELKAYGDAAQSDEAARVGEVGCTQRTLNRTSGRKRMAGRTRSTAAR